MLQGRSLLALTTVVLVTGFLAVNFWPVAPALDQKGASSRSDFPDVNSFQVAQSSEARVNTFTASTQGNSDLAVAPNGQSVVVWDSRRQQRGTYGVYLQRFDAFGNRVGDETRANLYQHSMQVNPCVAMDGQGGFWVAWESFGQDGSMNGIIARHFNEAGIGGDEILVNETTQGQQAHVVVAANRKGDATFVWTTPATEEQPRRLLARSFDATGKSLTRETLVQKSDQNQQLPSIAIRGTDQAQEYLLTWAETDATNRPAGIYVKPFFSLTDISRQPALQISPEDGRTHIEPVVTATSNGFAVGWLRSTSDDYQAVFRLIDDAAEISGDLMIASPVSGKRINGLALAASSQRGLVAAWNRSVDGALGEQTIVEAAEFDLAGKQVGSPFQINLDSKSTHRLTPASGKSRLALDENARLFAAWNGHCDDDKSAVGFTVLSTTAGHVYALSSAPTQSPHGSLASESAATAKPHDPPVYNPKTISRDRFGGDRNPFSRGSTFGFVGITNTGWRPPDPTLAVGPDHIVATTNGAIAFFDKDGTLTFQDEIEGANGFWGCRGRSRVCVRPGSSVRPALQSFLRDGQ